MVDLPSGYRVNAHDLIDSTNEEARRLADAGEAGGCIVWAKEQTAGRGRRGRDWVSKPGNLYVSILLRPDALLADAAQLSFAAALAVKNSLQRLATNGNGPPPLALKWPNDVLLHGKKLSGILLEGSGKTQPSPQGAQTDYLIVGIGINLRDHPDYTPYPATNMEAETGYKIDAEKAMKELVSEFDILYRTWLEDGFQAIRWLWLGSAFRLGEPIEVQQNDKRIKGIMSDLDEDGALRIETEDGKEVIVHAGDVYFPDIT